MVFTRQKNSSYGYFLLIFKAGSGSAFLKQLDPDPHSEKLLNSDAQKMNADPQPGLCGSKYFIFESGLRNCHNLEPDLSVSPGYIINFEKTER